jgi:MEMO1 family protein
MAALDQSVRPSPIAGRWYEGNPQKLAQAVDEYVQTAHLPEIQGEVVAVISPHAGHVYSGHVAGHAFAAIQHLRPEVVVVLSPLHQYAPGALYSTVHSAYETPLGSIPVDVSLLEKVAVELESKAGIQLNLIARDQEHSLEIELPFLQRIYTHPFTLLPLMVREQSVQLIETLGEALFHCLPATKAIVVASTDLSHFFPQQVAEQLDGRMIAAMEKLSAKKMVQLDAAENGFACGLGAVATAIHYAKLAGATRGIQLCYSTSGVVTGDYSSVVGYGALAIIRETI